MSETEKYSEVRNEISKLHKEYPKESYFLAELFASQDEWHTELDVNNQDNPSHFRWVSPSPFHRILDQS